jgi:hypothetical protein
MLRLLTEAVRSTGADCVVRRGRSPPGVLDAGACAVVRAGAGYNTIDVAAHQARHAQPPGKNAIGRRADVILILARQASPTTVDCALDGNKKVYESARLRGQISGAGHRQHQRSYQSAAFGLDVTSGAGAGINR